jgi:hypothetical protein
MLDLTPSVRLEPAPHDRVMRPHQFERRAVAKPSRHLGRTATMSVNMTARNPGSTARGGPGGRTRIADPAEELPRRLQGRPE